MQGCRRIGMGRGICRVGTYSRELFNWLHIRKDSALPRFLFFETAYENPFGFDILLKMIKQVISYYRI